jgi:hypothetical protein
MKLMTLVAEYQEVEPDPERGALMKEINSLRSPGRVSNPQHLK